MIIAILLLDFNIPTVSAAAYFHFDTFYDTHVINLDIERLILENNVTRVLCKLPMDCVTEWFYATEWENIAFEHDGYNELVQIDELGDEVIWLPREGVDYPLAGRVWPFGRFDEDTLNVIDVSDFREGYGFDLKFSYNYWGRMTEDQAPVGDSDLYFFARWYERNYDLDFGYFEETIIATDYYGFDEFDRGGTVSFTVPEGAEYCVIGCIVDGLRGDSSFYLNFLSLWLETEITAFEEQSQTMMAIQNELKKLNDVVVNGTPEQNQQISGSNDKMNAAGNQLGELSEQLQVEKPDVSGMDVSINRFIPETSILAYTGPILAFWNNDSLKAMLIIVLTLVLVSWVMFGKKG